MLTGQDTIRFMDGSTQLVTIRPAELLQDPGRILYREYPDGTEVKTNTPRAVSSFTISATNTPYAGVEFELKNATPGEIKKKRFGEVLLDGDVRLIRVPLLISEYDDQVNNVKDYLYILEKGGESYQLDVMSSIQASTYRTVSSRYRNVLNYVLSDCTDIELKTERLRFTDAEMIRLITEYNSCVGNNAALIVKKKKRSLTGVISVGGGVFTMGGDYYEKVLGGHAGFEGELIFPGKRTFIGVNYGLAVARVNFNYVPSDIEVTQTRTQGMLGLNLHSSVSGTDVFVGYGIFVSSSISSTIDDERAGYVDGNALRLGLRKRRFEVILLRHGRKRRLVSETIGRHLVRLGVYYRLF